MAGDDDDAKLQPVVFPKPSSEGLDIAASLADALGIPFNRDAVTEQALKLHETMFADLMESIAPDASKPVFRTGIYPQARAFAGLSKEGASHVVLDMIFDFWIFAIGHLVLVKTTNVLPPDQDRKLRAALDDLFSLFIDNHRFTALRDQLLPFLFNYKEALHLSHAITRSMTVSVLCHEYAHIRLGHLSAPAKSEHEFEADALGAEYFLKHVTNPPARRTTVYVDPKIACAPIILMRIFDLYEIWLHRRGVVRDGQHPSASERARRLDELMQPHLSERARYILKGMTDAIEELKSEF